MELLSREICWWPIKHGSFKIPLKMGWCILLFGGACWISAQQTKIIHTTTVVVRNMFTNSYISSTSHGPGSGTKLPPPNCRPGQSNGKIRRGGMVGISAAVRCLAFHLHVSPWRFVSTPSYDGIWYHRQFSMRCFFWGKFCDGWLVGWLEGNEHSSGECVIFFP